jgi:glycine cleavage system H protein
MSNIPEELKYTKSHEWVRGDNDMVTIGITDHAQGELTDIVYVELPEVGRKLAKGEQCAVVESVKTASDIYAPLEGEVLEINTALESAPELVNEDSYERGWFFRIKPAESLDPSTLLDSSSYAAEIKEA